LDALANGEAPQGFAEVLPVDVIKNGIVPRGVAVCCGLGAVKEVGFHRWCVGGKAHVPWKVAGDGVVTVEEGSFRARKPSGEKSNEVWWLIVEGVGVMIGDDIHLGIGREFVKGFVAVLMAFNMEDVDGDG
jgi:hypothetical protein